MLKGLSTEFTKDFGKCFLMRNLEQIRKFYKTYSNSSSLSTILYNQIPQSLSAEFDRVYFKIFKF
ncbi:MAG: hypothetical protein KKH44_03220 [Bacteroidetes bacterium]|nr:hypothetical protein [Bacteroidota bacterium]